jgi:quercetin dioxygenase-like cupin family protein
MAVKVRTALASVVVVSLLAAALFAQTSGKAKAKEKVWPAADMKWVPSPGAPAGVMQVALWGDSTKGAYGALEKFPAGFSAPLHTHSASLKTVVISGTIIHGVPGKPDVSLPAGSYLYEPANMPHTTACDKASECVFFLEASGKFDLIPAEKK